MRGCYWRMRVTHGVDVGPAIVDQKMHGQLCGGFATSSEFPAPEISDHQILRQHHPFADRGRRGQNTPGIKAHRNISVSRGYERTVVNPPARRADVAPVFVFGLCGAWGNGIGEHGRAGSFAPSRFKLRGQEFTRTSRAATSYSY
jgi:hypothetical protein